MCYLACLCRALAITEGNPQIEELLLRPLRLMTSLQVELIEPRPMAFLLLCKAMLATRLS